MKLPRLDLGWQERTYDVVQPLSATEILWNTHDRLTQVCSTQYLALPWSLEFQEARRRICAESPPSDFGSLGSHYLAGTHPAKVAFERSVATACQAEDAVGFSSGWSANFAVGELLSTCYDVVLSDVRNHNSLIRGLARGPAAIMPIDLATHTIATALEPHEGKRVAVVATSIHGLTGETVVLKGAAEGFQECLVVLDEVHSFGMLGRDGLATPEGAKPDVRVVGFSKALGVAGCVVCGPAAFTHALRQLGSPFVFSTVAPPVLWNLCAEALSVCRHMGAQREKALSLAKALRKGLESAGITFSGEHHITGIFPPPTTSAAALEEALRKDGFYLKVSQFPSRPRELPCIRVAFNPFHTDELIRPLITSLASQA